MKRTAMNLFALIAFLMLPFVFTACEELSDTTTTPSYNTGDVYDTTPFTANVPFVDYSTVNDADLTTPFILVLSDSTGTSDDCSGYGKEGHHGKGHGKGHGMGEGKDHGMGRDSLKGGTILGKNPLGRILRQLGLTDEQNTQIKAFITEYQPCHKAAETQLRTAQKVILDAANVEREAIKAKVTSGEIDRAAAKVLLDELRTKIQEQMAADPAVQAALAALKLCDETLLNNIKSILTADQLAKLESLLATVQK